MTLECEWCGFRHFESYVNCRNCNRPLNLGAEQELVDLGIFEGLTSEELALRSKPVSRQVKRLEEREFERVKKFGRMYKQVLKKPIPWQEIADDLSN